MEKKPGTIKKQSKRLGFTWDPEFKDRIKDIEYDLQQILKRNIYNAEIFFLCAGVGFHQQIKREVPPRKQDSARFEALKEQHFALLNALALADTQDFEVLLDEDAIYDIAEQYAGGGLMFLVKAKDEEHNFQAWLTKYLHKHMKSFIESVPSN